MRSAANIGQRWALRAYLTGLAAGFVFLTLSLFGQASARADVALPVVGAIHETLTTAPAPEQEQPGMTPQRELPVSPVARQHRVRKPVSIERPAPPAVSREQRGALRRPVHRTAEKTARPVRRMVTRSTQPVVRAVKPVAPVAERTTSPVVQEIVDQAGLVQVVEGLADLVNTAPSVLGCAEDTVQDGLGPADTAVQLLPAPSLPVAGVDLPYATSDGAVGASLVIPVAALPGAPVAVEDLAALGSHQGAEGLTSHSRPADLAPEPAGHTSSNSTAVPGGAAANGGSAGSGGAAASAPAAWLRLDLASTGTRTAANDITRLGRSPRPGTSPA